MRDIEYGGSAFKRIDIITKKGEQFYVVAYFAQKEDYDRHLSPHGLRASKPSQWRTFGGAPRSKLARIGYSSIAIVAIPEAIFSRGPILVLE